MFESITETQPKRFQCRHIHADGRRCGSPALRNEELCYYHHTSRRPALQPRARRGRQSTFDLPLTDGNDRTGLQLAIVDVLRRIAANQLDPRRAGLLLYGLQIAATNLPPTRALPQPAKFAEPIQSVEEIVLDESLGALAPRAEFDQDNLKARRPSITEQLVAELARGRAVAENAAICSICKTVREDAPDGSSPDGPAPVSHPVVYPDTAHPTPALPEVLPSLGACAGLPQPGLTSLRHRRTINTRQTPRINHEDHRHLHAAHHQQTPHSLGRKDGRSHPAGLCPLG